VPFEGATENSIAKSNLNVQWLSAQFVADMGSFKAMFSGEDWENDEVIRNNEIIRK
jgi:hypothetical protein